VDVLRRVVAYQAVLSVNLRRIRLAREMLQEDVAEEMRKVGCRAWTRATVAAVEIGRRDLSLGEMWLLQMALNAPITDLTQVGEDVRDIDVEGMHFTPTGWRRLVEGNPLAINLGGQMPDAWPQHQTDFSASERRILQRYSLTLEEQVYAGIDRWRVAEDRAAKKLRVQPLEVAAAAYALWHRGLTNERDARTERTGVDASDRMRAAHATRELQKDIAARIKLSKRRKPGE
jgi:transcriptional regulator with XRE-family HTH domain